MKSLTIGIILTHILPLLCASQVVCTDYSPKFSASTISKLQTYHCKANTRGNAEPDFLFAYVHFKPETDKENLCNRYEVCLNVGHNDIYTAVIPMYNLEAFAKEDAILDIDAGKEVRTMMDSVRIFTHIDEVYIGKGLPQSYQGNNTIIGIIDSGFDFTHPNFRDASGECRIKCVWDQSQIFATSNSTYGYGLVYQTTEKVLAAKHDMSGDTHGTHVAGIATGSFNNLYRGVAPKAEIVLVSVNKTEQGILDGIDFLLHYADKANKPLSINLSMGTILGYKDGTDNFSILIDNLMKDQKGRLLSIAAGNEGHRNSTLAGTFNVNSNMVKSILIPPSYNRDNLFLQGTAGHTYTATVCLKDTIKNTVYFSENFVSGEKWSKSFHGFGSSEQNDAQLNISCSNNPTNNNPALYINLSYTKPESEVWEISFSSDGGKYMINSDYGSFTSASKNNYADGCTDYTIACTATGHEAISVGAYVSKKTYKDMLGILHQSDWEREALYPLSGKGPTYDGRIKPDVVAPGATVISSFNSYAASYSVGPSDKVLEITDTSSNREYSWGMASGTSMATPVITGTLALWLEAYPELTLKEAKKIIERTSCHDSYTGNIPNEKYGMGKIDAIAGLYDILQMTSFQQEIYSEFNYFYDKNRGDVQISSPDPVEKVYIHSISGNILAIINQPINNKFHIELNSKGIYLMRIQSSKHSKTVKLVLH